MSSLQARSPLPEGVQAYRSARLQIRELAAVAKIRLQALRRRGINAPAAEALKLPLSRDPAFGIDRIVLRRAPDDCLVYSQTLTTEALSDWVATISSDVPLLITDVSSASVVLELSGAQAVDVLMRDCSLDLEGDTILPGACAQTSFAQTSVMIHRCTQPAAWRLFVERSVALHVWNWLLDTAAIPG